MKKLAVILLVIALAGCASQEKRERKEREALERNEYRVQYYNKYGQLPPEEKGPNWFEKTLGILGALKGAQGNNVNCSSNRLGNTVYTNCR